MFGKIGDLASLMGNMGKLREQIEASQKQMAEKLGQITAEGTAGGDQVTAKVNGHRELVDLTISDTLIAGGDTELLTDLIISAVNAAGEKVKQQAAEAMQDMTGSPELDSMVKNILGNQGGTDTGGSGSQT